MFTGWTNQMSSWIGAKKGQSPSSQEPTGSPSGAEEQPEPAASAPAEGEVAAGAAEGEPAINSSSKGIDLFSSMKSQVTNWLGPLSAVKKDGDAVQEQAVQDSAAADAGAADAGAAVAVAGAAADGEPSAETAEGDADKDKESFGSGLEEVSTKALQGARTLTNFFASAVSKAGKTVTEAGAKIKKTVEETSLMTEFNREQEAFIKGKSRNCEGVLPPWAGYPEEETLKEEILSLSTDRRNFVRSPPAGVQFEFDYETMYPVALATLVEDSNLQQMRFDLVPKIIKEELFWRNYFYRVSLIRQSTQLSSLANQGRDSANNSNESSFDEDDKTEEADAVEAGDSPLHEFVSDAYQNPTLSKDLKEVQEGIKRLGAAKKRNDDDWEKELQAELQDYELASEGSGKTDGPDGDDIEEMLDAEEMHDLK